MDLNPFMLCGGLRVLGYSMVILVAAVIGVSYYAVVFLTLAPHLHSIAPFTLLIVYHALLLLLIWSYFAVVLHDPGSVPDNWRSTRELEILDGGSSVILSESAAPDASSSPRWPPSGALERRPDLGYCLRCQNGKPPRCHHCSICQRCVLKMDHHCVWVVNCVGARNYKFFLLFLLYTFLGTTTDAIVLLPSFIEFFGVIKANSAAPSNLGIIFLAFVLNLALSLSLLCFVIMHASLLLSNTTTIEVYEKKKMIRWKYDLGWKRNFEQVFGMRKALWFFPMFAKEDLDNISALHGLSFPITHSDMEP